MCTVLVDDEYFQKNVLSVSGVQRVVLVSCLSPAISERRARLNTHYSDNTVYFSVVVIFGVTF